MSTVTVRNLPDEIHRALNARATKHGRSTEAEIRNILEATVNPPERLHLGTALAELGRRIGLTDADVELINQVRDRTPIKPIEFE
ncbi:MAG: plasmid stability protein [Methylobacillus sp.]|nr:plasmid stability protein [Methylobacillus sp.]